MAQRGKWGQERCPQGWLVGGLGSHGCVDRRQSELLAGMGIAHAIFLNAHDAFTVHTDGRLERRAPAHHGVENHITGGGIPSRMARKPVTDC